MVFEIGDYLKAVTRRRGEPPIAEWPGRVIGSLDIMAASGDPRDWFLGEERRKAHAKAWGEFFSARERGEDEFTWNEILIAGFGHHGNSTLGVRTALHFFGLGRPVFSNVSCLFGWHFASKELYNVMAVIPLNAVVLVDVAAVQRLGGVAALSLSELTIHARRRSCTIVYVAPDDWMIPTQARLNIRELWVPQALVTGESGTRRLEWHVWDDYPYRRADRGEPRPDSVEGEELQRALLLNDTFGVEGSVPWGLDSASCLLGLLGACEPGCMFDEDGVHGKYCPQRYRESGDGQ